MAVIETARDEVAVDLELKRDDELKRLEEELAKSVDAVMKGATALEKELRSQVGKPAKKAVALEGVSIAEKGQVVPAEAVDHLKAAAQERVSALDGEYAQKRADAELLTDAAVQQQRDASDTELATLRQKVE